MPSTYTTNLGIEKIATGEQSGTWGTTTNTNFDLIDTAVNGIVSITLSSAGSSGSPNDLPITDGTASNGRNKFIEFTDGGDLGATAYVQLTPNDAEKIVHIRNSLSGSRSIIAFQGTYNASNDFEIPNGADVTLKFDGAGSGATVTDVNADLTVTGLTATSTVSFSGATIDNLGTVTTVDINGGTIDGTVIGGSSAAAGTFTTFTSTGIDDNATSTAITINASENVGIGTTSPSDKLHVYQNSADNVVAKVENASSNHGSLLQFSQVTSGSVAAPVAYVGHGGDNTGDFIINNASATNTKFYTSGSERMRINSAGNVGIGTTSPNSVSKLQVEDTTASNTSTYISVVSGNGGNAGIVFGDSDADLVGGVLFNNDDDALRFFGSGFTERMRIDSSGNVGIGTTSPTAYTGQTNLNINSGGVSRIDFDISDSLQGYALAESGYLGLIANTSNYLMLGAGGAERMRIDSSGDVCIGITSPYGSNVLNVNGGVAIDGRSATTPGLCEKGDNDTGIFWPAANALGVSTGGAERMRISDAGNVYIGTTNNWFTATGRKILRVHGAAGGSFLVLDTSGSGDFYIGSENNGVVSFWNQANADLIFATNNTERMRILPSGNIGMGLSSDYYSAKLAVGQSGGNPALACRTTSTSGSVPLVLFTDGNSQDCGSIDVDASANTTNYGTSSDQRLKENIVDAPAGNIDDVRVRSFDWKSSGHHQTYGLVAQELVDVAPEAVSQGKKEEDTWKIDYSKLVPMMIKEIQDLKAEVAALKGA
jgi:hypothetical protein